MPPMMLYGQYIHTTYLLLCPGNQLSGLTRTLCMQTISQMYTNRAHFISMNAQLTEQLGMAKVAGTLSKSTEVMKIVNDLMRTPQLMQTMQQMSREMMKVGRTLR